MRAHLVVQRVHGRGGARGLERGGPHASILRGSADSEPVQCCYTAAVRAVGALWPQALFGRRSRRGYLTPGRLLR